MEVQEDKRKRDKVRNGKRSKAIDVGERSRILKFSTHHQDQSIESSSNE
jgi:hypothetical protein